MENKENEDLGDLEDVRLIYKQNQETSKDHLETYLKEKENMKNVYCFRVMNVISLAFIFLGCFLIWLYSIIIANNDIFYEFFKSRTHHFQMDYMFFHICWGVILSIIYI